MGNVPWYFGRPKYPRGCFRELGMEGTHRFQPYRGQRQQYAPVPWVSRWTRADVSLALARAWTAKQGSCSP